MTAVKLNYQQKKFADFSQIHLNDDDERCGEVFITLSRTLIFHCCVCASNFGNYDYFLDHLSTEHYEDVQGEVIEIDAETEKSDIEGFFEDDSLDKQIKEQDSVKDEIECDDYKFEELLQKVEVHIKPKFGQIEEVFLEEPCSLSMANSEHTIEESEEFNIEKIKDEAEIEEQTLCTQLLNEQTSDTKNSRPSRRKDLKSFSCKECGKAFKTNQKLRRHYVTHSEERNHQCKICGFAFKEKANLDAHVRRHTGIKTISCGYCSKKFFTASEAKNHQRIHTGERPYVCPTCGVAFSSVGGLNVHAKKHFSEPDYKCNYCDKGFYGKGDFKDHLLVHTKEKPYVCHICAARFPRHKSMVRHAKLHERKKI